jgi:hypothetical protein
MIITIEDPTSPRKRPSMFPRQVPAEGFTRTDLLALATAVALLFVCAVRATQSNAVKSTRLFCVNNLRQIGNGLQVWAADHSGSYSWKVNAPTGTYGNMDVYPHFQIAADELPSPRVLVCPSDTGRFWAWSFASMNKDNVSYFISLHPSGSGGDRSLLAGDRNVQAGPQASCAQVGVAATAMTATSSPPPSWNSDLHFKSGNLLLNDLSVQPAPSSALGRLANTDPEGLGVAHLLIP